MREINWGQFEAVDMRVGTILSAELFPEARKPAYKLVIDFGVELGQKKSSAQITTCYTLEDLIGKQIIAVVNFPPKQIGPFISQCLVLGTYSEKGIILLQPSLQAKNGDRVG
ncbi:MAG: tRNA-binding protein [Marinoscillum sp.]|jgi:tRNA-binding protein